jgi:hypothetical protein
MHILTAKAEADHFDRETMSGKLGCNPGIHIEVEYHPGFEAEVLDAFEKAYRNVRDQIRGGADAPV